MLCACLALAAALLQEADAELPWSYARRFHAGWGALSAGNLEGAQRAFEAALELSPENANTAFYLACVAARAEDRDGALEWLARAADWGYADRAVAVFDPDLAALRGSEAFAEVLARMGPQAEAGAPDAPAIELDWSTHAQWIATSRRGHLAVLENRARVYVWDLDRGELAAAIASEPRTGPLVVVDFEDEATRQPWALLDRTTSLRMLWTQVSKVEEGRVYVRHDPKLRVLDPRVRLELVEPQLPFESVGDALALSGARLAVTAGDGSMRVLDLEMAGARGLAVRLPASARSRIHGEGSWLGPRVLAVASGDSLSILDRGTLVRLATLYDFSAAGGRALAFHPDGERLAVWSSGTLRVARLDGEVELGTRSTCGADYGPDGTLYYADATGLRTWDSRAGARGRLPLPNDGRVRALRVSPRGDVLATISESGLLQLWALPLGRLLEPAASWTERGFIGDVVLAHDVRFSPDGAFVLAVAGAGHIPSVHCRRTADPRELLWKRECWGGPAWMRVRFMGDEEVLLSPIQGGLPLEIVDVATGRGSYFDKSPWTLDELLGSADGRYLVVRRAEGFLDVFDAASRALLYRWGPRRNGASVAQSASGHYQVLGLEAPAPHALRHGVSLPLDAYASILLDPKRVLAAAAGIHSRVPALPELPALELVEPKLRFEPLGERAPRIVATAECADGLLGFEVERDRDLLPREVVEAVTELAADGTSGRIALELPVTETTDVLRVRVRAVSRTGVLGRPRVVTFRR